jgi:hypothetical protein
MTPISRPELENVEWRDWRAKATAAMRALVEAYAPGVDVTIRDELYKAAMPFLLQLSHQKCVYCESIITASQPGDVEHYRPKGRIRDKNGKIVTTTRILDREIEHPGYWWLAYDWVNLLPACIDCNRRRKHGDFDAAAGKAEYFAISGPRAVLPTDNLSDEKALLLDPSEDGFDPNEHFDFLPDGKIRPKTERAAYTCELLGLNLRETLVAERERVYLAAHGALIGFWQSAPAAIRAPAVARDLLAEPHRQVNMMWEGESSHTAFARRALQQCLEMAARLFGARYTLPLPPLP